MDSTPETGVQYTIWKQRIRRAERKRLCAETTLGELYRLCIPTGSATLAQGRQDDVPNAVDGKSYHFFVNFDVM